MITLHDIARTPTLLVAKLQKLEKQGRFDEALKDCLRVINGEACIPSLEGADQHERAELMLRYGALIGYFGHNSQIANSQEQSKDLLTKALAEFIALQDEVKVAECENYIALAYWRIGEINEASIWLDAAFSRSIPRLSHPRLSSYIHASLLKINRKQFRETIALLQPVEEDFLAFDDPGLLGMFYVNLGIACKDTGRLDNALQYFEYGRHYHRLAKHNIYVGTVENNIALLYRDLGDFPNAHAAIDSAITTFRKVRDKTRTGFALDTKANIFLSEGKFASALATIDKSIEILKRGENAGYRVESLLTRAKILLHLDRFADATMTLLEAVDIQRLKIDEDAARQLVDEFEAEWRKIRPGRQVSGSVVPIGGEGVQLLLPRSLSTHRSYSAVRINNSYLEKFGLRSGTLAVIADDKVERGDLVAIEDLTDRSVRCGLFDSDFGLVCLERGDSEPELFDENTVRILGKIVGIADNANRTRSGELIVQPITV
jgi:tetratricopeptide (TPR) repeat protein